MYKIAFVVEKKTKKEIIILLFQKKVVPLHRPSNHHNILSSKYNTMIPFRKLKTHFLASMTIGSVAIFHSCKNPWPPIISIASGAITHLPIFLVREI